MMRGQEGANVHAPRPTGKSGPMKIPKRVYARGLSEVFVIQSSMSEEEALVITASACAGRVKPSRSPPADHADLEHLGTRGSRGPKATKRPANRTRLGQRSFVHDMLIAATARDVGATVVLESPAAALRR